MTRHTEARTETNLMPSTVACIEVVGEPAFDDEQASITYDFSEDTDE
jgi:hypothetical protein